jgi:hypothetical protein
MVPFDMAPDAPLRSSVPAPAPDASDACSRQLAEVAVRHLATADAMRQTAWELAAAGLRAFRPELSEQAVQREVRRLFRRAAG